LFVATKKQAKDIVAEKVGAIGMPYVTERWFGGMLTNFPTIRKAVKKMSMIDKMEKDGTLGHMSKRERLQISRQREKLDKNLGSIVDMTRIPAAVFVVDIQKEKNAVAEARRLNIPVFAIVDTNSNPNLVDFAIPANDDAAKSISLILDYLIDAVKEGLSERKIERDKEDEGSDSKPTKRTRARKSATKAKAEAEADEDLDENEDLDDVDLDEDEEEIEVDEEEDDTDTTDED